MHFGIYLVLSDFRYLDKEDNISVEQIPTSSQVLMKDVLSSVFLCFLCQNVQGCSF